MVLVWIQIFKTKKCEKRRQLFVNNNARFIIKANKEHYPQMLLEECKYEQKNIKILLMMI